ncbi:probable dual specificity protein phosphatase DDB_G0283417 [Pectinophora gossypiella]|uniref:probable dual specificity protein phosphatase DDB_G0283417 n=1 Tax=Pectinophora gossypiella TaxID=13191 RepID=UPI00214E7E95|nr:probable dual specificity protein phosphatase DDB_G0283417 [Pectinophora gossypiella]
MSFLDELKKRKNKLKVTETVVTNADGQRFIEKGETKEAIAPNTYGFIVDTKPDDIPALIAEFLYIGSQDCTSSRVLQSYNIKNVLSLGINLNIEENINHKFVECLDLPETDIKAVLKESLPFINNAIDRKENILIHCNAGVSRTSTVAIAYLMQYKSMNFDEAYNLVKEIRPAIQPNAGFKRQLKNMNPGEVI